MMHGVRYSRTRLDIPILVFICARLLSIIFSEYPSMSYSTITRELIFYVSFFFTVFYLQHAEKERIYSLLKILIGSTVIVTVISVSLFLFGFARRVNTLGGGGMLSTHLALLISVALIAKDNKFVFPKQFMFWLTIVIFIIGLLLSETRGDWLAAAAALLIYGLVFNRKLAFGVIAFAAMLAITLPSVRQRLYTFEHPLRYSSDRITLWTNALSVAGAHPVLGFGPETFHKVFKDTEHLGDWNVGAWHNDIVQMYVESGIIGVASFLFVIGLLILFSIKLIRSRSIFLNELSIGWMGVLMLAAYLISGLFTMPTISITNGMLFRFLIAMVAVEHQRIEIGRAHV